MAQRRLTANEALIEAMTEEMRRDGNVFILGEEVVGYEGMIQAYQSYAGMEKEFGARMVSTTMSEVGMIGACVGAAISGMRPICDQLFSEMLALIMAPLIDASMAHYFTGGTVRIPLVIRMRYGVGVTRGHPADFHPWLLNTPGVKVVAPSNAYDAKGLMKSAIRDDNPVVYLEHLAICHGRRSEIPDEEYLIPIGEADVKREGKDLTVVAIGNMVNHSLKAAEELAEEGVDIEVVDLRTIIPMDRETIKQSVRKTGRLVVAQENWKIGSTGSEIAAFVAEECFSDLKAPIVRMGMPHVPFVRAPELIKLVTPTPKDVVECVRQVLSLDRVA